MKIYDELKRFLMIGKRMLNKMADKMYKIKIKVWGDRNADKKSTGTIYTNANGNSGNIYISIAGKRFGKN